MKVIVAIFYALSVCPSVCLTDCVSFSLSLLLTFFPFFRSKTSSFFILAWKVIIVFLPVSMID